MNFNTIVWKNLHSRIWFLVSTIIMLIVFTVTMIATQTPLIRNTLYIALGYPRAIIGGQRGLYEKEYGSKAEVLAAANELNTKIASEGFTLLQNKGGALPLQKGASISVFGQNSVDLLYGGSGSGGDSSGLGRKTIFDSLTAAGLSFNPVLKAFYEGRTGRPASAPAFDAIIAGYTTGETSAGSYTAAVTNSYAQYPDAALVVITRIGGEGFDLPRTMAESYTSTGTSGKIGGARSAESHYLQLDENEAGLLLHVTENFDKVILIINSNNPLELGFLDDPGYWANTLGVTDSVKVDRAISRIRGALWIGSPGGHGIMALGPILTGEINPSGRTVDIYARDFTKDPSYFNFGNNNVAFGNAYRNPNGSEVVSAARTYFIEYEEGVYVGYRYYETRGKTDGAAWYDANVMYPMGHGLSYSEFEWTLGDMKLDGSVIPDSHPLTAADAGKSITVDITVKNKAASLKAGKDVVQLYVEAPYTAGGIEKPHVMLADFAKTELLQPGASQTLTLKFSLYDIASYDYNDGNGNTFKGFETEAGGYKIHISENSDSWADNNSALTRSFTVPQTQANAVKGSTGFTYRKDPHTAGSKDIVNRFDDVSYGRNGTAAAPKITYLSRAAWGSTMPAKPTADERRLETAQGPQNIYGSWSTSASAVSAKDVEGNPWYAAEMPVQAASESASATKLIDMLGVPYGDERWDAFADQLTVSQMVNLVGKGAFGTIGLENIGVPLTTHADGPAGFANFMAMSDQAPIYSTCFYASECVIGATFNKDLAYQFGKMVGNEALIGNERGDGLPYSGWYAPAANIHRSPFSGRNWEYFSEDPVLSGRMAAKVVLGAKEKGVVTFAKHFALNDQETNRSTRGLFTWANEQSMREIYFKAFEILIKESKSLGIMSSYNRIGTTWAGGDYRLLTEILRGEWKFEGVVITDYADKTAYMYADQMIRAGGDLQLNQTVSTLSSDAASATHVTALRNASKNILYMTVNSNAMNYEILGYRLPSWIIALISVNAALFAGFAVWGFFAIRGSIQKAKRGQSF